MARRRRELVIVTSDVPSNDDQAKVLRGTVGLDGAPKAFMRSLYCINRHCAVKYSQSVPVGELPAPLQPTVEHIERGLDALFAGLEAKEVADRAYYLREWETEFLAARAELKRLRSPEPVQQMEMAIENFKYYLASPDVCRMSAEHALCNVGNALLTARDVL
jgi:hypothetical protein